MKGTSAAIISIALAFASLPALGRDKPISIQEAVEYVSQPAHGFDNMSPFELQVHYRLAGLLRQAKYKFEAVHALSWKACMLDEKANMYGRFCAAHFLLDDDEDARKFISKYVRSKNLRFRYNAVEALREFIGYGEKNPWGVDLLISLVADGSLDGSGVTSSPNGKFPDGDRDDIMQAPLDDVCATLGGRKERKAVDALIGVLARKPNLYGAAFALGEIGDEKAIPALLKVLKDGTGEQGSEVDALAKFKCKEAVPLLLGRLGKREKYVLETENILHALLVIGDDRAVPAIDEYIRGKHPKESKDVAKRVLVKLKNENVVGGLVNLLADQEDEHEKGNLIWALAKHPDPRAVAALRELANNSDSAFIRLEAIGGLGEMGTREALLGLAALVNLPVPKDLKAKSGVKGQPEFSKELPRRVIGSLKRATGQDFGTDQEKWTAWISENVNE